MSGGIDFSGVLSAIDGGTAVTAVVAAAGVLALVGFSKWGSRKVAGFFDGVSEAPGDTPFCEGCGELIDFDDPYHHDVLAGDAYYCCDCMNTELGLDGSHDEPPDYDNLDDDVAACQGCGDICFIDTLDDDDLCPECLYGTEDE